jgi:hypothetical protein
VSGEVFVPIYNALGPVLYVSLVVLSVAIPVAIALWQDRRNKRPDDAE